MSLVHFLPLLVSFFFATIGYSQNVSDRLVLQLNNTPYSQRQIESYMLVKSCLQTQDAQQVTILDARNWPDQIEQFRVDMLFEQESQRLGSFVPSEAMVTKGIELIKLKFAKNPTLAQTAERLQVDERGLNRIVAGALQVEAFRRSKQRQSVSANDEREKSRSSTLGDDSAWIEELNARSLVRYYKDAKVYVPIRFN